MCEDTPAVEIALPLGARAAAAARSTVRSAVCATHRVDDPAALILAVSELVNDSALYGDPPVRLRLECSSTQVSVEVAGGLATVPLVDSAELARRIRVRLLDRLTFTWGEQVTPPCRRLYATFAVRGPR